jgi:hypothetical protein
MRRRAPAKVAVSRPLWEKEREKEGHAPPDRKNSRRARDVATVPAVYGASPTVCGWLAIFLPPVWGEGNLHWVSGGQHHLGPNSQSPPPFAGIAQMQMLPSACGQIHLAFWPISSCAHAV